MRKLCLLAISVLIVFTTSVPSAQDSFEKIRRDWDKQKAEMENQWEQVHEEMVREWTLFKQEVERKWQEFVHSTNKDWVEYSPAKDTRSRVDFEKGKIIFEAVVPENEPAAVEKARQKIEEQVKKVFNERDIADKRVLENQVVTGEGKPVVDENLDEYLQEEVLKDVEPEPKPYQANDGVKRRRYSVEIDMVPEHIRIRAEKYLPIVKKNAGRFKLKPQLILAVIHTESYFNPRAISSCNAVGIMQIIPKYAGKDAYRHIYGKDKKISRKYLFNPENNIELGSAYLALLRYRHFRNVEGETKNRYVSICGYNWGPTAMRKKIIKIYPLSTMADEDVYRLLREKTPAETRDYIKKVRNRMPVYDAFFEAG